MNAPRALALALLTAAASCAESRWLRLASPHFEIFTDAGERTGRVTLDRLEQIRQAFRSAAPARRDSPLPVRVFLFATEAGFRKYRTASSAAGHFIGGPERDYIVMHAATPEAYRIMFHEYVHVVLNHVSARLPQWLEEGLAEFYSTLEPGRGRLRIGKPVASHVRLLGALPWIAPRTLLAADQSSPYYNSPDKAGLFYAQSWALVHMLNLSPRYRDGFARFSEAVVEGGGLEQAYELPLDRIWRDLEQYVRAGNFPIVDVDWQAEALPEPEPARTLDAAEADLALGDLARRMGHPIDAGRLYERVVRLSADSVEGQTGLGTLALARGDFAAAREHLSRAIALGSRHAETYFEHAMLLRETGAPREQVMAGLRRTIELNPNLAEAQFLLGTMLSAGNLHAEALEHLRRAAAILPRQAHFWHALSLAHHQLGQRGESRQAAQRALNAAVTAQERAMAEAALQLASTAAGAPASGRPAVTTPESWRNRRGDATVQGSLRRIECLGQSARLHIDAQPKPLVLLVANPSEVVLRNFSSVSFEFQCGPQQPRAVIVEYLAATGVVTAIEFPR